MLHSAFNIVNGCQPQTVQRQGKVPGWIITEAQGAALDRPSASAQSDEQEELWVQEQMVLFPPQEAFFIALSA